MSHESPHHIVPYKTYGLILVVLLALTTISVAVTQIDLGGLSVFTAIFLATIKSTIVLIYFMHLKFDSVFIRVMVASIFLIVASVTVITLLDYIYR